MCDPGYFGANCELKDYAHYVFDRLRLTWYPYVLIPIVAIAWFVVSTWKQIPRHADDLCDFIYKYFDNLGDLEMAHNEYELVHKFFWPSVVVSAFATVLGFACCYRQWVLLTVATGFQLVAIVFQIVWARTMKSLDGRVSPLNSYNVTLANIVLEIAYLTIPLCLTIRLIQEADKLTDYFYAAVSFQGAALVLGMAAIVTPRAFLLGGAYVYGDLEVFHWSERIDAHKLAKDANCTTINVDDQVYT